MKRLLKIAAIVVGVIVALLIATPFFFDVNTFRPKLESELSTALGRQVKVGNLSLSLLSGSVSAEQITIADDPAFSRNPFVQASSLKVGVEVMPLLMSKELHVTELTLNQPEVALVRSADGEKWNFSSLGASSSTSQPAASSAPAASSSTSESSSSSATTNLSVAKLNLNDGRLTVTRAGQAGQHVYDHVNLAVQNFSLTAAFPFQMSAGLPAGGKLSLDGTAGPINAGNAAATPLQAKVNVSQANLASSGFLDPASGIAGIADFDGTVKSDGRTATTEGTLKASNLQLSPKGKPAGKPVQLQYAVTHDLAHETGTITKGDVQLGKAVAHLTGTYDSHAATTSVNMHLAGEGMPVDDLEAMLPALGVILPSGSQLKGGTLATNLAIVGPVDKLVTSGTVKLQNSALAGFNLGSKLAAVSALSGKPTGGNDTSIENFSSNVRVAPEGTKADNINLNIPAFGVLTGAGTVSPSNALDFKMTAALSGGTVTGVTQMVGLGGKGGSIPFAIQGTTSDPKFVPDIKGMAGGLLGNALGKGSTGNNNTVKGIMGIFKKP
jgi:AsmA protein